MGFDGEDDVDCWEMDGGVIFVTVTSLVSGEKDEKCIGVRVTMAKKN